MRSPSILCLGFQPPPLGLVSVSVLVWVLGRLAREGWVTEEEIEGLAADKIATIKEIIAAR